MLVRRALAAGKKSVRDAIVGVTPGWGGDAGSDPFPARRIPGPSRRPVADLVEEGPGAARSPGAFTGQTQPRTRLAGLLWGDRADEQARNSLRQTLFELRRVLGPAGEGCLVADHERVALNPINLSVDVLELEGAAGEDTLAAFERAAALYGGELLAGLMVKDPAFEGWLAGERERLHELGLRVLGALLTRQIATEACRSEPSRRPCASSPSIRSRRRLTGR